MLSARLALILLTCFYLIVKTKNKNNKKKQLKSNKNYKETLEKALLQMKYYCLMKALLNIWYFILQMVLLFRKSLLYGHRKKSEFFAFFY